VKRSKKISCHETKLSSRTPRLGKNFSGQQNSLNFCSNRDETRYAEEYFMSHSPLYIRPLGSYIYMTPGNGYRENFHYSQDKLDATQSA